QPGQLFVGHARSDQGGKLQFAPGQVRVHSVQVVHKGRVSLNKPVLELIPKVVLSFYPVQVLSCAGQVVALQVFIQLVELFEKLPRLHGVCLQLTLLLCHHFFVEPDHFLIGGGLAFQQLVAGGRKGYFFFLKNATLPRHATVDNDKSDEEERQSKTQDDESQPAARLQFEEFIARFQPFFFCSQQVGLVFFFDLNGELFAVHRADAVLQYDDLLKKTFGAFQVAGAQVGDGVLREKVGFGVEVHIAELILKIGSVVHFQCSFFTALLKEHLHVKAQDFVFVEEVGL